MTSFRQRLLQYPKASAAVAGTLIFLVALGLSFGALLSQLTQEMAEDLQRLSADIRKISAENHEILARLNAEFSPECSPHNLAAMSRLLFEYGSQRDIGLYDEEGKVFCTSSMRRLPVPLEDRGHEYRTLRDNSVWINVPSPASNGRGTLIHRQGDFNISMSPGTLDALFGSSSITWLGGNPLPVHVSHDMPPALQEKITVLEREQRYGRTVLPQEGVVVMIQPVQGTWARIASYRPLSDAWQVNPVLSALLLVLSLVCGMLTATTQYSRLTALNSLPKLLPALLTRENMHCRYQPIVDMGTGHPVACEVLVRLQHGEEVLGQEQLIQLTLKLGLTWKMDASVIEAALEELSTLPLLDAQFKFAFNLFPDSINHEKVDALFKRHLAAWKDRPLPQIGLEVTEYDFSESLIPELQRLRDAGYHIAVDDFGTGYSNLNTVKKVEPDLLKIDKSFIGEIAAENRASLIPEIIAIARALDARVVAEGVEEEAQAKQLLGLGVDYAQGYYFARPMALDEFADYLRKHGVVA